MNRRAPLSLLALALATAAPAQAACVVPGHRIVPVGHRIVFSFRGLGLSFQQAFRAADASVAGLVDTGDQAYRVSVVACHIRRAGTHGITGTKGGSAHICIDTAYAGLRFTDATRVTDRDGDTFNVGVLAWHELGHVFGLGHPGSAGCQAPASVMNREMADNGAPGRYGPADLVALRHIYGGR